MRTFMFFCCLFSLNAAAEGLGNLSVPKGPSPEQFAEHKQKMLSEMNDRIKALTDEKSCLESAADISGVELCRRKAKEAHEKLRESHHLSREKMREERMKGKMPK